MALFAFVMIATGSLLLLPFWEGIREREFYAAAVFLVSTVLATFVLTRFVNRKPFSAVGLGIVPGMGHDFGMGCLLGFLMVGAIYAIESWLGYIGLGWRGFSLGEALWILVRAAAFFAVSTLAEELLFRGYLFQTLVQALTFLPALLVFVVLFALGHVNNPNATGFALVNSGLAGVWFSFAYQKTRSLWLPFGLHFSWNFSQTTLFSFPTSGMDFPDRQLFSSVQTGPDWLTGGAYGPEGGMLCTLALIVCTAYILKSNDYTAQSGAITLDSIEDLLMPGDGSAGKTR
jgi:membrane protease YdiL (CAAX protease family)